ncbi:MAG: hypothetical protein ACREFJ_20870 [Acetobacteraceae bacterium]
MNVAQVSATAALAALNALYNDGTLTFYQGAIPATPETAIGTQSGLAQFALANPAFSAPTFANAEELATASFANSSVTPTANGTACFARAVSNGATLADYTVAANWQPSTAVIVGQYVINGANTYVCVGGGTTAASGGPTGSGVTIQDGNAVWSFRNSGSADIVMATTSVLTAIPLSMTGLTHAMPAV